MMCALHVYLNENKLRSLPAGFFTLGNIAVPYISFNECAAIPPRWGDEMAAQVPNRFTSLEGLGKLIELRHLNMADKELEQLPEDIGNLKLLRVGVLSRNRLRSPPEGFGAAPGGLIGLCDSIGAP